MLKARIKSALTSPAVKKLLYRSGALDRFHRRRNKHALTVVMYHRVIAPTDPRFATCDPEYSLSAPLFEDTLRFFRKHYHVISMDQLLAAADGRGRLPERPLLITFDDGWADNHHFCTQALERAGLPATLFVVSDAVDTAAPFWQEKLVIAWRRGALTVEQCRALWRDAGGEPIKAPPFSIDRDDLEPLRGLIARLELLDHHARDALLAPLAGVFDDGVRHMIDGDELRAMAAGPFTIGGHGKTHTPLLRAEDPDHELSACRAALAERLGAPPSTMSFPHGSHSPALVDAAHRAGYHLVFTSVSELAPTTGRLASCLPRVGFTEDGITDDRGAFAPEELALLLFRKPISAPAS